MTVRRRIICFGEVLLRLTPPRGELLLQSGEFRANFAGAEANVAVALASFGHEAEMLSVLPDNPLGRAALSELRRHNVDTRAIRLAPGRMGTFYLMPGAVRRPSEVLYDRAGSAFAMSPELCNIANAVKGAAWFHVSGVTPALGRNCADATLNALQRAQEQGLQVSFDGNYRSKLWESWKSEAPAILRTAFEQTNILFGNDRDIALALDCRFDDQDLGDRRRRAADAAFRAFPKLTRIACTTRIQHAVDRHDYGAEMYTRDSVCSVAAIELSGIVDRVGTGDSFAAGVIHKLVGGATNEDALRFGHAAACLKHSIPGDFMTLDAKAVHQALASDQLDLKR